MKLQKINLLAFLMLFAFLSSCGSDDNTSTTTTDDDDNTTATTCDTDGEVSQSINTEIEAMRTAFVAFRASLSDNLLSNGSTCLNNERFYLWHNTPSDGSNRNGIYYQDLTDAQLTAFKEVMKLFLSTDGYDKVYEITELAEGWLNSKNSNVWNPVYYSIDMFGNPETSGSWGFQLDGHHCVVNFLVHGDNVSIVPAFFGGEPAKETYNGEAFDIFEEERDLALSLYNGLTTTELASAVTTSSTRELEVGPADRNGDEDPYRGDYDYSGFETGLKYSDMSADSQANLILLMKEYVYTLTDTYADVWWTDVMANIDDTYFVWIDNVDTPTATSQFYYRIYNPYLWAEFNTEDVTGASEQYLEDWNHVHTITRIPNNPTTDNGGDYGIFALMINQNGPKTLYEHYAMADHHSKSAINFDYIVKKAHTHNGSVHSHSHHHSI